MNSTFFFYQDTIISPDTAQGLNDSVSSPRKFSTEEVDDIFMAMERRERELDSIARVRAYYEWLREQERDRPEGFDTTAVPYNLGEDMEVQADNPIQHLRQKYFSPRDTSKPVFYDQAESARATSTFAVIQELDERDSSGQAHEMRPDWLLGVIIGSLILLAWLKLFYNKFLDQTLQSVANYQLSAKLLRDQNIFSRRVAFLLNLNFVILAAATIYLVFAYFRIRPLPLNDIYSFLVYAGIIAGLLILRYIVLHLVGFVFRKQDEFKDYLHQLLLIYKTLGVSLIVLVIGIAYINENLRIYLLYLTGVLVLLALIFRIIKGIKIILSNKDVLIFYLILYLCTLEILPLLIFYRFFSLSVQAG